MNKKIILFTCTLFIIHTQTISSSYFSPQALLTWITKPSISAECHNSAERSKKTNWVDVSVDSNNNLSDVTIPRLVTINDQPEIKTISPRGRQLSTNDHNNSRTQKRTLSLPNRRIADQTNPKRTPRSRSSKPIQVAQCQTDNNLTNPTANRHTIHIVLRRQSTS